jgi:6-phosphogluconate dehydrogenase
MDLGLVGLGKMGANMARRLVRGGHRVVAHDLSAEARARVTRDGVETTDTLDALVARLSPRRVAWVMVPAGEPTEQTVTALAARLAAEDIVVDGGNSHFEGSRRLAARLAAAGIHFVDVGVSGGVWGLENGYSMMVGGNPEAVEAIAPLLRTLAPGPDRGWARVGPSGAGHYAKMVHNGIEYGLMQAYAEGFEILRASAYEFDLRELCAIWNHGSVVRSWLLELAEAAFAEDAELRALEGWVPDSGEGRWTLEQSVALDVPAPVLYAALMTRFRSRQEESFQAKVLAALRQKFGGHAVRSVT